MAQWRKGKKYPFDIVIVDNSKFPEIPVGGEPEPIPYS
jgi:hypothetical protein